jgi:hypothetical protein
MNQIPGIQGLDLQNQVSVTVAKKSLDSERDEGAAMVELLQQAAQTAPQAKPSDGHIDVYG